MEGLKRPDKGQNITKLPLWRKDCAAAQHGCLFADQQRNGLSTVKGKVDFCKNAKKYPLF